MKTLQFKDRVNFETWGRVRLELYRKGELEKVIEDSNVVTETGRLHILKVAGNFPGSQPITQMEVGNGGCGPPFPPATSALFTPQPFALDATVLRHSLNYSVAISEVDPDLGSLTIKFTAYIPSSPIPHAAFGTEPKVINEIALKSGDGVLVALRAFESLPFNPDNSMELKAIWTLGIV